MIENAMAKKSLGGRPKNPPSERLLAYGIRIAPDKKVKLLELKRSSGMSIRQWFEEHVERDFAKLQEDKAIEAADRRIARAR
jgi:hypothetical protein